MIPKTNGTIFKECKVHGICEHALRSGSDSGRIRCRKCARAQVVKRRKQLKVMAVEYKGGKCEKCGYNKCITALEFHHLDPAQKDFEISHTTVGWNKIKQELNKCIMVCSNCHREIESGIQ